MLGGSRCSNQGLTGWKDSLSQFNRGSRSRGGPNRFSYTLVQVPVLTTVDPLAQPGSGRFTHGSGPRTEIENRLRTLPCEIPYYSSY
jgi:hypothetical protein